MRALFASRESSCAGGERVTGPARRSDNARPVDLPPPVNSDYRHGSAMTGVIARHERKARDDRSHPGRRQHVPRIGPSEGRSFSRWCTPDTAEQPTEARSAPQRTEPPAMVLTAFKWLRRPSLRPTDSASIRL
jgi:hypothetical protein